MGNSRKADENIKVKKRVKEAEKQIWAAGMQTKSVLKIYRSFKKDIAKKPAFYISRESSLLFDARRGVLQTKRYKSRYQVVGILNKYLNKIHWLGRASCLPIKGFSLIYPTIAYSCFSPAKKQKFTRIFP